MIKELRIDNLVLYGAHGPVLVIEVKKTGKVRVEFLSEKSIENGYYKKTMDISQFDPIPLTPEWLERCGFVKNTREEWDGPKIELEHSLEWFTIKGYRSDSFMLMGSEWTMGKPFHYLHQLQNLYFALTGEELTIKELP